MKRIISFVLSFVLVVANVILPYADVAAVTFNGTCGENITWTLDDTGTLTICGTGAMENYFSKYDQPWRAVRGSIERVIISDGVTEIGDCSFSGCNNMAEAVLPDSIVAIGNGAFSACTGLESIVLPAGITTVASGAFSGCKQLFNNYDNAAYLGSSTNPYFALIEATSTSISSCEIHPDTQVISGNAFAYCSGLTSITIPSGVVAIGDEVFDGCSNLMHIEVDAGNGYYSSDDSGVVFNKAKTKLICAPEGLYGDYTIPSTVTTIGYAAFEGCDYLQKLTIPNSVILIEEKAIYDCVRLREIYYQGTKHQWDNITFGNFNSWNAQVYYNGYLVFANGVCGDDIVWTLYDGGMLEISGTGPMYSCSYAPWENYWHNITQAVISDGITSIGDNALRNLCNMENVEIPDSVTSIGDYAFKNCGSLTEITIPNGVTSIGDYAFENCEGLAEVVIPSGVTYIGAGAFQGNCKLKKIIIPQGVSWINEATFSNCSGLEEVIIPSGVIGIDSSAFFNCSSLEEILLPSSILSIGSLAFADCTNLRAIIIPRYVTTIEPGTFMNCQELMDVSIPRNVTRIGNNAFQNCYSIMGVEYEGTKKQWKKISIGSGNGYLVSAEHLTFESYSDKIEAPFVVVSGSNLTWEAIVKADSYEIYRSTEFNKSYIMLDITEELSYEDTGISAGRTYYYKIKAVYGADTSLNSDFSNVISLTRKLDAPEIFVENGSSGKPVISWEKVSGTKKYTVYRATSETGKYTKLGTTTKLTYTDTKASAGNTYFYKVIANGSKSKYDSGYSNIVSCGVICGTPSVTVKVDAATGKPSLSWSKISGATKYVISRQLPGEETFAVIAEQITVTFKDTTAPVDTECTYMVQALGKTEELNGKLSKEVSATSGIARPAVNAGVDKTSGKPTLSWEAVEGAVKYEIYRSTKTKKSYKLQETVEELSYADTSVSAGKTYYYKVVAIGENSKSAESAYAKLTGKCATPVITVENGSSGKPVISWEKVSGAKKYTVYRATSENGKYKSIGTSKIGSYTDTKASAGTTYFYKVVANASKSKYSSGYSNIVSCGVICGTPAVKITNNAKGEPVISWSKVSGATKYKIMYMDVTDYTGSAVGPYEDFENYHQVTLVTGTSFTLLETEVDRMYMVSVVALAANEEFNSEASEPKFAGALCAKPKAKGKVGATGKPEITWEAVEGAVTYKIYRSTKKSSGYKEIAEDLETLTFTDTTAKKGKTYYYKVVAVSYYGESQQSDYVKVKSK